MTDEEFVRSKWPELIRGPYSICLCLGGMTFCSRLFGIDDTCWAKAAAFTRERLEQIAEVEAALSLLEGWRFVIENNSAALAIYARENAFLAELRRGMKP